MDTLGPEEFKALQFTYNQGFIDAHNGENHFEEVIANWLGLDVDYEDEEENN